MYIVKWNRPMGSNMINRFSQEGKEENCNCNAPATNVLNMEKEIEIDVAAPGRNKDDFKINLEKDVLTISYKNGHENNVDYTLHEFGKGSFCRSFTLPETVNVDEIKAKYKNGILSVILPKAEEANIKKEIIIS